MEKSAKFISKRLDDLKQATILNNLANIDFENEYDLYNQIIVSFQNGELDSVYSSPFLNSLSEDEKQDLLKKCRKYFSLCFADGDVDNWLESADSYHGIDFNLFLMEIFSNFDILLEILKYGGEDSLEQLVRFQNIDLYSDESAISFFRSKFFDDDTLKQVLIELGQKDNLFGKLSDEQKAILCTYPQGNLCTVDEDGSSRMISPISLGYKVTEKILGDVDFETFNYDEFVDVAADMDKFIDAVTEIYLENSSMSFVSEYAYK